MVSKRVRTSAIVRAAVAVSCVWLTSSAAAASWTTQSVPGHGQLSSVTCPSSSSCTAVGDTTLGSGNELALVERWNGQRWSLSRPPLPPGTETGALSSVSCSSAHACTVIGTYSTAGLESSAEVDRALVERWNGTRWTVQGVPVPAVQHGVELQSVSCPTSVACTAVGTYLDHTRSSRPLIEHWNGIRWSMQSAAIPPHDASYGPILLGVSCSSADRCTLVGNFNLPSQESEPLAERWNGHRWSIQSAPAGPGGRGSELVGVSCFEHNACLAVGGSSPTTPNDLNALAERWNGTHWSILHARSPQPYTSLNSVSCPSESSCSAAGYVVLPSQQPKTLIEHWNGSGWSVQPSPSPKPFTFLNGIACRAGSCTAVGYEARSASATPLIERSAEAVRDHRG